MTDRELEMRVQQAFDAAAPDIFDSVMAECSAPRGKVVALTKSRKKKSGFAKRLLSIAAVMALLICAAAGGAYVNGQENAVASVVTLDVNPSVELRLNARDKVVDAAALNGDGQAILSNLELRGEKLSAALAVVIGSMRDNGYLTPEKNSVLVTVDNSDTAKAEALQQRVDTAMAKVMETADFDGAVISQVLQKTDEVTELARSLAISPGKSQFVSAISAASGESVEELAKLNISDLNLLRTLKNLDIENIVACGTAGAADYISEGTAALEALKAAGAEDGALPDVNVDVDVADGELVYNVSFSFGGYDYNYEVSPNSGSIKNCVRQFADDMEALAESFADGWENWGEAQGDSWEDWGEATGDAWEAWGEAQGDAWENWGENYADAWEAWAENYADEWETWAEQHPDEWKKLIEQYPEKWEAWAKQHSDEWNSWLSGNADSLGELGEFLRSWTSLFNKWWN